MKKFKLQEITVSSFITVMDNRGAIRGGIETNFTDDCSQTCDTVADCSVSDCKSSYPGGGSACHDTTTV